MDIDTVTFRTIERSGPMDRRYTPRKSAARPGGDDGAEAVSGRRRHPMPPKDVTGPSRKNYGSASMPKLSQIEREAAIRLKVAREESGYHELAAFARLCGMTPDKTWNHEKGRTIIDAAADQAYTQVLGLPVGTILFGRAALHSRPLSDGISIPIAGTVSDTIVRAILEKQLGAVSLDTEGLAALLIEGDDLKPAMSDGDRILFRELDRTRRPGPDAYDRYCVIRTSDGRQLVRMCGRLRQDGRRRIYTHSGDTELAVVTAISPIRMIVLA